MTLRAPPLPRAFLLLIAGCSLGCDAVLGAPDYRVVEPATAADALVGRFASGSAPCADCLATGACGDAFERCAEIPGCVDFATCILERPSPASKTECVVRLEPTEETRSTVHTLSRCYAQCVGQCRGGSDFSCVGAYRYPGTLPRSTIRVRQTFRFVLAPDKPTAGLEVSFCRPGMDCGDPITTATTDETGTYNVEVPIGTAPLPEVGFRGYRVVHGEAGRLFPHRLYTSRPLMVDHDEETGLVSEEVTRELFPGLGVTGPFNILFLQVFDCRGVGAGGLFFEIDSRDAVIVYVHRVGSSGEGPTVASQEGAAVAAVTPGEYHEIRAVTANGQVVAADRVYVPGDALVLSTLFPKEME